jgi:hypothetical protein
MIHELKTWPEYFRACRSGDKTFELRLNDRGFKVEDVLVLREFDPCRNCTGKGRAMVTSYVTDPRTPFFSSPVIKEEVCPSCTGSGGKYTGEVTIHRVAYVLDEHQGIRAGYVVMGIGRSAGGRLTAKHMWL